MGLQAKNSHLIGGKGGAGPSSLHTTLEGPTEYVCECKVDVKVYMDSHVTSNGHLDYFQRTASWR